MTNTKNTSPKGLIYFALLLFATLAILLWYSKRDKPYHIVSIEIKQSTVRGFFEPAHPLFGYKVLLNKMKRNTEVDTNSQRILIAGDSMSAFLAMRLNDYCSQNNHSLYSVVWNSGTTYLYAHTDTLDYFIKQFEPSFVIIVLGANELKMWKPETKRADLETIIKKIENIPYIWVGPPNWTEDTGINNVILQTVGRKRFFPSKNLNYTRQADGSHPDKKSSYMWMDSIASFIMHKSKNPIVLNMPDTTYSKYPSTSILNPKRTQ